MTTRGVIFCLWWMAVCLAVIKCAESGVNGTGEILSRKKRYLIFPEGSSLQLVYCLTMPIIGRSTIFTIGGTAALAWELPHDPFQPFRQPAELLHRRVDKPGATSGWATKKVQAPTSAKYQKVFNKPSRVSSYRISNPAYFFKTSPVGYSTIRSSPSYRQAVKRKHLVKNYNYLSGYNYQKPISTYIHPVYHHVHKRTRRDLYSKLEKFFTAQSKDGRACLLKSVCEVSQASQGKGTFMEEIIKAVFRTKLLDGHDDDDDYDRAANRSHNCTEMYPTCQGSVWNVF